MRLNYKKLGPYIEQVNNRNIELEVDLLLGVSIKKVLMPSIANTVGTNMNTYKIIKKGQFAYGPVTSRNGDKISVGLLEDYFQAIVSQAYTVFKVKDENDLLPEYLMMWFRRPEFDRYARFKSHGSARETFDWEEMCDVELPIPPIAKQKQIVNEYNTIVNQINLNQELNKKLEESAQSLYEHWFVDFEFPLNKEYAESIGKPELVGKPYKSSGGEMVYDNELQQEIPAIWKSGLLTALGEIVGGTTPSKAKMDYWSSNGNGYPWISPKDLEQEKFKFIEKGASSLTEMGFTRCKGNLLPKDSVLFSSRAPVGYMGITSNELVTNQGFKSLIPNDEIKLGFSFFYIRSNTERIAGSGTGSTFNEVSGKVMKETVVLVPDPVSCENFNRRCEIFFEYQSNVEQEIKVEEKLKNLLLSRLTTKN